MSIHEQGSEPIPAFSLTRGTNELKVWPLVPSPLDRPASRARCLNLFSFSLAVKKYSIVRDE